MMTPPPEGTEGDLTEEDYAALEPLAYVCWRGEGTPATAIIELGDTTQAIITAHPRRESATAAIVSAIAAFLDAPISKIFHSMIISTFLGEAAMRKKVTGKTGVCFTVLRSCACNYDASDLSERRRWRILSQMIDTAEREGTPTISTTAYRKAIAGRPIPNSTRTITPAHLAALLREPAFRHRLMDEINARPTWAREQRARRTAKRHLKA